MLNIAFLTLNMDENTKNKFEQIYYKYRNLLFTYARSIVNSNADAEDILQNAFIKISDNMGNIGEIDSKKTKSYLIIIVKSCAYDFLRSNSNICNADFEIANDIPATDDIFEKTLSEIQYEQIVLVIKNIPSPYCEVLYLHYVNDYSVKHTALLLKRKRQTVKTQLVRGKRFL